MQYERDCINREIVPSLKEFFLPYRITIRTIDLRWGINMKDRDESDVEQSILRVCMDEIDRSRPFFIGLLGHRYGWVPNLKDDARSVTEMEIVYGAMHDSESKRSSIFCLRNMMHSPVDLASMYCETTTDAQEKVQKLRNYVLSELSEYPDHIKMYNAKLDEEGRVYGLEDFKDYLTTQLKKIICDQFGIDQSNNRILESDNKRLQEQFESYIYEIQYIPRENKIEELILQRYNDCKACLIWGDEPCGKSVMLCYLYRILKEKPNIIPLYYNTSLSTGLHKQLELLNLWNYQLSEMFDYPYEEINQNIGVERVLSRAILVDYDIISALQKLEKLCVRAREKGYSVVFFIDGADELCGESNIKQLFNIIPEQHIIFTAKKSIELEGFQCFNPGSFTQNEIERYLKARFDYYDKELHNKVVVAIANKIANVKGNQLWLDVVSYLLLNLDAEDFKKISEVDVLSEEEKIETYFLSIIDSLPTDVEKLFLYVYTKSIKHFNQELVYGCLKYISGSRIGLRDCDLQRLLGDKWSSIEFAAFRRWFSPFIVESYDNKCWKFVSTTFQKALLSENTHSNASISLEIANLLWGYDESDEIRRSELFYYLEKCSIYDKVSSLIIKENKYYTHSIISLLNKLDDASFEKLYHSLLEVLTEENRVVCACQILLHFRFDIFINDINFGNKLLRVLLSSIDLKNNILSEYAYVCLAALLENVSHYVVTEDKLYYGEILYQINTIRYNNYPSEKSRDVLTTSIYILASNYMKCGNINKAQEYFLKLQSI